jgi:uncharacterized protein (DUF885 family)
MRSRKVFPIKRYHEKLLSLYQKQLKKWRNDIDNWDDKNLKMTEIRIRSVEFLIEKGDKYYVGF